MRLVLDEDVKGKAWRRGRRVARFVAVRAVVSSMIDQRWRVWVRVVMDLVYIQDSKSFCVRMMAAAHATKPMLVIEMSTARLLRRSEVRKINGITSKTRIISVLVLITGIVLV